LELACLWKLAWAPINDKKFAAKLMILLPQKVEESGSGTSSR